MTVIIYFDILSHKEHQNVICNLYSTIVSPLNFPTKIHVSNKNNLFSSYSDHCLHHYERTARYSKGLSLCIAILIILLNVFLCPFKGRQLISSKSILSQNNKSKIQKLSQRYLQNTCFNDNKKKMPC